MFKPLTILACAAWLLAGCTTDEGETTQACEPQSTFCVNGDVYQCDGAGSSSELLTACPSGEACEVGDDGSAACVPLIEQVCDPLDVICVDGDVHQCDSVGSSSRLLDACLDSETCEIGSDGRATCVSETTEVCTPGERSCREDGGAILECDGDGSGTSVSAECGASESCQIVDGAPTCVPEAICTPGESACSDDDSSVVTCNDAGTGYDTQTCAEGDLCDDRGESPVCVDRRFVDCVIGDADWCSLDGTQVLECTSGGGFTRVNDFCTVDESCVEPEDGSDARCVDLSTLICTPGTIACSEDNTSLTVCNDAGTGFTTLSACGERSACVQPAEGDATCEVSCTTGDTACSEDGTALLTCNEAGDGYDTLQTCFEGDVCDEGTDGAACIDSRFVSCVIGDADWCSLDATQVIECTSGGTATRVADFCTSDEACVEPEDGGDATCVASGTLICTPGSIGCAEDANVLTICNDAGTGFDNLRACLSGGTCVQPSEGDASCVYDVSCTTGDTACSGDATSVLVCNSAGDGYDTLEACAEGDLCDDTDDGPACVDQRFVSCLIGDDRWCSLDGTQVLECTSGGGSFQTYEFCPSSEACVEPAGDAYCGDPVAIDCETDARICNSSGTSVLRCVAPGEVELISSCGLDTSCQEVEGEALCLSPGSCTSGTRSCSFDGGALVECQEGGGEAVVDLCAARGEACADVNGTSKCVATGDNQICTPGEQTCTSDRLAITECSADGLTDFTYLTCPSDTLCVVENDVPRCTDRRFVPGGCNTGERWCSLDNEVVYECTSAGASYRIYKSCTSSQRCYEYGTTADCDDLNAEGCTVGETFCSSNLGAALSCTAEDDTSTLDTCLSNETCAVISGEPVCFNPDAQICTPDSVFCASTGYAVMQCSGTGESASVLDRCASYEVCDASSGTPTCVIDGALSCTPGQSSCNTLRTALTVCKSDGSGTYEVSCGVGEVCEVQGDSAACVEIESMVCEPWERFCDPTASAILVCDSDGLGATLDASCESFEICEISATTGAPACVDNTPPGGCTPRERSCSLNGQAIEECRADGTGTFVYATCDDLELCDESTGEPLCIPDPNVVCTPDETFCSGDTIRACNAEGTGSTVVEACTGGQLCTTDSVDYSCACVPEVTTACGSGGDVVYLDSCGNEGAIVDDCQTGAPCNDSGATPVCGDCTATSDTTCGYDGSNYTVNTLDSCGAVDGVSETCTAGLYCSDVLGSPACLSSVTDSSSPWYTRSCVFSQFLAAPTALPADCRCLDNRALTGGIPDCWRPYEAATRTSLTWGSGPRVAALPQAHLYGGFVSGGELIVVADWSSSTNPDAGAVFGVDLTTGARRVLSGEYIDADGVVQSVGSGPRLSNVVDVEAGPGGMLYVWSGTNTTGVITRVDPFDGDRAVVWERGGAGFAQCENGRDGGPVQTRGDAFAMDSAGAFYLAFANTSPSGEGLGVIRIEGEGVAQSCAFVTRSGTMAGNDYAGNPVGTGYAFTSGTLAGLTLHDGALYAINAFDLNFYAIDLVSGDRSRVTSASTSAPLGAGPTGSSGVGLRWSAWDASRNLWWTTGRQGGTQVVLVDPSTAERVPISCNEDPGISGLRCISGSLDSGLSLNFGGFWLDPADADFVYFAHDGVGVVKLEVSTGNSVIFSL